MEARRGILRTRVGVWVLWGVTVLAVFGVGSAGAAKFSGDRWMDMFERWGYAPWFALVIGAAEVGGSLLLLYPRLASYAAVLLIMIMIGAIGTVLTNETGLGPGSPSLIIVLLSVILVARWKRRWRPRSAGGRHRAP